MKITTTLMLTTVAVAAFWTGGALAADLGTPAPAPAAPAPAPTNWDGPYIGASIGWGWGTADFTDSAGFTDTASPNGFLAGAQLGYYFHFANQLVGGIEGNIDWVNESANFNTFTSNSIRTNWEGSIRARLGWDVDSILPYIEAGVAFANATGDFVGTPALAISTSNTHTGWTVGVGAEFMIAPQLSTNVEYRYSDYGSQNYAVNGVGPASVHLFDNTVRVGLNYHF